MLPLMQDISFPGMCILNVFVPYKSSFYPVSVPVKCKNFKIKSCSIFKLSCITWEKSFSVYYSKEMSMISVVHPSLEVFLSVNLGVCVCL